MRVASSDEPEMPLTATVLNLPVQDAGLAAKAGNLFDGIGIAPMPFSFAVAHVCRRSADVDCTDVDHINAAAAQSA